MKQNLPHHVAIVMDGNGRWAENKGLPRVEGHREGIKTVKEVVRYCLTKKISILSLFAFSSENWTRPIAEVEFIMQLFIEALENEIAELNEQGVCLRFTGSREQLSPALCARMERATKLTASNKALTLNIAVNYSGKWDIVTAAKAFALQVLNGSLQLDDLDDKLFSQFLNTQDLPDPDLFIRTGKEQRISNFFLWQIAYTELYFSSLYWPDFNAEEFDNALMAYNLRERRFGQTSEQLKNNSLK